MKTIDSEELKAIQIEILDYFDSFCKRNNIHYWIDYGTLIGAIRHKGYIPWDDDIDVGMLRADYSRAQELFNKQSNGKYEFQTPTEIHDYRYPFGKVIRTDTVLYEYGRSGIKSGVYIDVFPYDNCPATEKEINNMFKRRDFLGRLRRLQLPKSKRMSRAKSLLYALGSVALKGINPNTINCLLDENARKNELCESASVSCFVDPYDTKRMIIPKTVFQELIDVEFEGNHYPAPAEYDYILRSYYGDYMLLPPEEERTPHHVIDAFYT